MDKLRENAECILNSEYYTVVLNIVKHEKTLLDFEGKHLCDEHSISLTWFAATPVYIRKPQDAWTLNEAYRLKSGTKEPAAWRKA